jgi:hypothetical protein
MSVHPEMNLVAKWECFIVGTLEPSSAHWPVSWVWIRRAAMIADLMVYPR